MISLESPFILILATLLVFIITYFITRRSENRSVYLLGAGAVLVITAGQFSLAAAVGLQIIVLFMAGVRDADDHKRTLGSGLPALSVLVMALILVNFNYHAVIPLLLLLLAVTLVSLGLYLLRRRVALIYGGNV